MLTILHIDIYSCVLLTTDVAAIGLDIPNVQHVIHYQVSFDTFGGFLLFVSDSCSSNNNVLVCPRFPGLQRPVSTAVEGLHEPPKRVSVCSWLGQMT